MAVNITKKSPGQNASAANSVGQWPLTFSTASQSAASLESVCRSVAELARSSPKPPRRLRVRHGSTTVEMEWPEPAPAPPAVAQGGVEPPAGEQAAASRAQSPAGSASAARDDGLSYVCAPMVGTFYRAEEPGAAPLVSVGDLVQPGQAVGVFEVMKMLSTVRADVAGRVAEILVADGQSVEYQQRLVAVEPVSPREDG